ncbi:unnamed protein product [Rotaria magnacalcarata]
MSFMFVLTSSSAKRMIQVEHDGEFKSTLFNIERKARPKARVLTNRSSKIQCIKINRNQNEFSTRWSTPRLHFM